MGDDSTVCHVYNDTKQLKYFNWRLKKVWHFLALPKLIWATVYRRSRYKVRGPLYDSIGIICENL